MAPVTAIMVGAGQRGHHVFGAWATEHPGDLEFVAVVDPDPQRRARFGARHAVPPELQVERIAALPVGVAEAAFIATPDQDHPASTKAALRGGYHVYLEKPIAPTLEATVDLVRRARAADLVAHVGHVLRSTPFFLTLRDLLRGKRLGEVITVQHRENLAAWHMAHSFVRGNWSRAGEASPMIVAKCCHDFDILDWLLDDPVERVWSYGSLWEFRPERAPAGATERCTDGCPVTACPYDARHIYLNMNLTGWPVHVLTDDLSATGRLEALQSGRYGRCVYTAGSDVVDHQVVAMELASGASAGLTMHGHSGREERTIRIDGSRGTLRARFGAVQAIEVLDHALGSIEVVPVPELTGGHAGGDDGSIRGFLDAVRGRAPDPSPIEDALESHLVAFAAEASRLTGEPIDLATFRERYSVTS